MEASSQLLLLQDHGTLRSSCGGGSTTVIDCGETSIKSVRAVKSKSHSRKKAHYLEDDPRSPSHVPILAPAASSTTTRTSRHVTTGCCVGMGVNRLTRHRRPLSGSYSALVRLSIPVGLK